MLFFRLTLYIIHAWTPIHPLTFHRTMRSSKTDYCNLFWGSFTILHRYYVNFVQSFNFRPVKRNDERLLKNIWCRKKTRVFLSGRVRLSNLRCWRVRWSVVIGMSLPSSLRSSKAQATVHVNIAWNKWLRVVCPNSSDDADISLFLTQTPALGQYNGITWTVTRNSTQPPVRKIGLRDAVTSILYFNIVSFWCRSSSCWTTYLWFSWILKIKKNNKVLILMPGGLHILWFNLIFGADTKL